jgi:hypothetical protein
MYLVKIILLLTGQCSRPLLLFAWWYVQLLRLHILSLTNSMLLKYMIKKTPAGSQAIFIIGQLCLQK